MASLVPQAERQTATGPQLSRIPWGQHRKKNVNQLSVLVARETITTIILAGSLIMGEKMSYYKRPALQAQNFKILSLLMKVKKGFLKS
jgi:hypothetical protein